MKINFYETLFNAAGEFNNFSSIKIGDNIIVAKRDKSFARTSPVQNVLFCGNYYPVVITKNTIYLPESLEDKKIGSYLSIQELPGPNKNKGMSFTTTILSNGSRKYVQAISSPIIAIYNWEKHPIVVTRNTIYFKDGVL